MQPDLIGQAVSHRYFGKDIISSFSPSRDILSVSFLSGEKRFSYPEAFEEHLTLRDDAMQKKLVESSQKLRREKAAHHLSACEDEIRRIAGLRMVPEDFSGEYATDGVVPFHPEYQLFLPEEKRPLLWKFFQPADCCTKWGNIPFRYFDTSVMLCILLELEQLLQNYTAGTIFPQIRPLFLPHQPSGIGRIGEAVFVSGVRRATRTCRDKAPPSC